MPEILMPRLSDTMESGMIVRWHKQAGDQVTPGETLAEIETDKAVMEYEAYEGGVLGRILVPEGEEAAIGDPIAILGDEQPVKPQEAPPTLTPPQAQASSSTRSPVSAPAEPPAPAATDRPAASPLARRDARQSGVDLSELIGSGPGGRIIRADVRAAAETAAAPELPVPADHSAAVAVPLGMLRRTSARRLADSARTAPHIYLTAVADVEELVKCRQDLNERLRAADRQPISLNDLIVRACGLALRKHPEVNASVADEVVRLHSHINIGIAVAADDGLLVPVVRDVDRKSITTTAQESQDLAGRARQRRLRADEMTGGTFTVSNLGMYGVEHFTAIINPPEAAILAVGAARREAVVLDDGSIAARTRMRYTLSADHRILDGAVGARFLAELTSLLQDPWLIVA
ncbi:dihydrolipoamide acetyltransferase family protein [Kribbella sp. NPDC050459]|uniref:dihydrolipoamide acetyltransferase family protein n=1 Tax=Kribbella sp. NPDC050459 TaxID=3155785 RepID=UPI003409A77E